MSEKKGYQLSSRFHLRHMAFIGTQKKVEGRCTFLCDTSANLWIILYVDCVYDNDDETTTMQYSVK